MPAALPVTKKNDPFSSVPKDQKGPPWIAQSGPCIGTYVTGNATRYLARPSS